jgi:hypothetical protein
MNMARLLVAFFAVSASAYVPMAPGAALTRSKVASSSFATEAPVVSRTTEASMSAVTRRDADGNPITNMELFDPIYAAIAIGAFTALLVANPF